MDAEELLRRYAVGERDFRGVDLSSVDLTLAILDGANLSGTNLEGAYLQGHRLGVRETEIISNCEGSMILTTRSKGVTNCCF